MPIGMTDEQQALREAIRACAAGRGPADTRSREPAGRSEECESWHLTRRWKELAGIGVFSLALPEADGGAGAGVTDLAAGLEQVADELIPGPVLSTAMAGVLLSGSETPAAQALVPRLAEGQCSIAVALAAGELVAVEGEAGEFVVSGAVSPVLGAEGVSHLLLCARIESVPHAPEFWFLLDAQRPELRLEHRPEIDFSRSVSTVTLRGVRISSREVLRDLETPDVRDLAVTLFTAEAAGVAGWCLRTAVEHARTREQFGAPIGSFQAVKHLCAGMLCRAEQASALAWDAARAWDQAREDHPIAAAASAAVALDGAVENAKDCVQVLGGTGFTWEHDAHLYLRRALALRQLIGGSAGWRRRAAELALDGARRNLRSTPELPAEIEEQRAVVRAEAEKIRALPEHEQRAGLADSGYLAPHWPKPYGLDASPALQLLIDEELAQAGITRPDLVIGGWAAPTILRHGTDAQRERFVRPTLRGEITWCQLFSEPEAGSDLAALRTRAERDDGGWRLRGQKVWTSLAQQADWAICLARTDPDASKHKGITYFLVDMRAAGIEVRPLREITGEAVFNEVFLDGVYVPDDCVVGEIGGGWKLARTTLANERVAMSGGSWLGQEVERLLDLARRRGITSDSAVREKLGTHVAEGISVSLLRSRATLRRLGGQDPGPESSVEKLVGVDHRQRVAETALDLLGPDGAAVDGESPEIVHEFLLSRCLSIAGGTTQILRTLTGERVLGLPREGTRRERG